MWFSDIHFLGRKKCATFYNFIFGPSRGIRVAIDATRSTSDGYGISSVAVAKLSWWIAIHVWE